MILPMIPKARRVTVTDAARNFADLVNRAFYRHETTVLVKNGVAVAYIGPATPSGIPASEALTRWRQASHLSHEDGEALDRDIAKGRAAVPPLRSPWD